MLKSKRGGKDTNYIDFVIKKLEKFLSKWVELNWFAKGAELGQKNNLNKSRKIFFSSETSFNECNEV